MFIIGRNWRELSLLGLAGGGRGGEVEASKMEEKEERKETGDD